jgi:SAM-dependent methyltransferase
MLDRSANYVWNMLYGLEQKIFDLRFGVATAGRSRTRWDVFTVGGTNWAYEGCQWPALSFALRDLKPAPRDVFVDLGSGKGKALLIAASLPYRRVVGVEIDSKLAEAAQSNLARASRRSRSGSVEQAIADILDWPIPDDATTIFMFNPFFGETFRAVMERVFDSYDRNPRDLHIVYDFPWEHDWLVSTGRVVVESVRPKTWPPRRRWWERSAVIVTYHVTRAGEPSAAVHCPLRARSGAGEAMRRWRVANGHPFGDAPGASGRSDAVPVQAEPGPV